MEDFRVERGNNDYKYSAGNWCTKIVGPPKVAIKNICPNHTNIFCKSRTNDIIN